MVEVIIATILIAFGFFSLYYLVKGSANETQALAILLISLLSIIVGGWIIFTNLQDVIWTKIRGIIAIIIGLFLLIKFPDVNHYQKEGVSSIGIFIGLVLLILGIYWLIF